MPLTPDGWFSDASRCPSPNFDARPQGEKISLVVVHAISLPPGEFGGPYVEAFFSNRLDPSAHPYFATIAALRVSAHLFVRRDGFLMQFVSCLDRAWHAGVSRWQGRERCNDFSIGIELEGADDSEFADAQYRRLNEILAALATRFPIEAVVGHSDVAPGRKTDPGPCFDWTQIDRLSK